MPGISGLEVLKRTRADHLDTCFLMLSALIDTDVAAAASRLGVDDFLTNPWDPDDLEFRLNRAKERRAQTPAAGGRGVESPEAAPVRRGPTAQLPNGLVRVRTCDCRP